MFSLVNNTSTKPASLKSLVAVGDLVIVDINGARTRLLVEEVSSKELEGRSVEYVDGRWIKADFFQYATRSQFVKVWYRAADVGNLLAA